MVLVDTSVFVNFFKGTETHSTRKFEEIVEQNFCVAPVVYQELLQGARDQREFDRLDSYLRTQIFCFPLDPVQTFGSAARLFFNARRQGITIRSTIDCLIAQMAIEHDIPLLHDDHDFDHIAKISDLKIMK